MRDLMKMRWPGPSIFDRYTDEAKKAIFFARYEAIVRGGVSISPADLLAGLTWEQDTRANSIAGLKENVGFLWWHLGIPHLPCTAIRYSKDSEVPLDRDSKIALAYVTEEANKDGEYWIDTDHLARALLRFENEAGSALLQLGKSLEDWRSASKTIREKSPSKQRPPWASLKTAWTKWSWLLRATSGIWVVLLLLVLLILILKLRSPV